MARLFVTLVVLMGALPAYASAPPLAENPVVNGVLSTILYSGIGIVMMLVAFKIIALRTPGRLAIELTTEKNTALAIVVGSFTLGVSIIIAAAIAG